MKTLICIAALAAFTLSAQTVQTSAGAGSPNIANTKGDVNVKAEVAKATPVAAKPEPPAELLFTELQNLKIQLAATQLALLNKKYDIQNYNKEAQPLVTDEQSIFITACRTLGIPEPLITTQCGVEPGVDSDGKVKMGADNKPIPARVWWNKATAPVLPPTGAGTR